MNALSQVHDVRELGGVVPPMITPFAEDDSIDRALLGAETKFLLQAGVNGLVVGGSTGEGAGMSAEELYEAVSVVVEVVEGAVPLLAGVIADTSAEAIRLGLAAKQAGALGLQVPPPHFHFTTVPEVLARYYRAITDGTGLPLIIYNVIPWAQVAIESLDQITGENPMIFGVKQSGGNIHALANLLACMRGRIRIYSAIDDLIWPSLMLGADGTISGTSSVFPRETVEVWRCVRRGNVARGLELHNALVQVWRSLDGPQFPSHVKYALKLLGRPAGKPRGPFTWPRGAAAERIESELRRGGFLPAGAPLELARNLV
jgi:4-hydroxy-tetrahydrodipicolinate synthase